MTSQRASEAYKTSSITIKVTSIIIKNYKLPVWYINY